MEMQELGQKHQLAVKYHMNRLISKSEEFHFGDSFDYVKQLTRGEI